MKAIFEVEFDPHVMANEDDVNEIGGWTETMQWLYLNNGFGIFDEEIKLVKVEERDDERIKELKR